VPPIFVARAGLDVAPLNAVIDQFAAAALAANAPLTLMNHPQGKHGFDALNDDDRSREIIRAAIAFMHTHLEV
jgi:acetyl esterase/lipase